MVRKFTHRLRQRGYPLHMIIRIASRVSHAHREQLLHRSRSNSRAVTNSKPVLVIPYAQMVPELQLPRTLRTVYMDGGDELHALLPQPLVAHSRCGNLGAMLVKASP